jgi:hypothetical protein
MPNVNMMLKNAITRYCKVGLILHNRDLSIHAYVAIRQCAKK